MNRRTRKSELTARNTKSLALLEILPLEVLSTGVGTSMYFGVLLGVNVVVVSDP